MSKKSKTHVLKVRPVYEKELGKYIPYCLYGWHQGIPKNYELCEERKCTHYVKLFIKDGERL